MLDYGDWLKRARHFRGMSAKTLANQSGLSLNFIQRIEGGSRMPSNTALENIHKVLGFSPDEIGFESAALESKIQALCQQKGIHEFCTLSYVLLDGRPYYTDCQYVEELDSDTLSHVDNVIRLDHALANVQAQRYLFEGGMSLGMVS